MIGKALREVRAAKHHGIKRPFATWRAARRAHIPFWVACSFLEQETGGGANVFGHDPTIFVGAGEVTKDKYLRYRRQRMATGQCQGVGPMQLTYSGYQDTADALGGCWRPYFNMVVGFSTVRRLYNETGSWRSAARSYNGSGPAAERYADQMEQRFSYWRRIFA